MKDEKFEDILREMRRESQETLSCVAAELLALYVNRLERAWKREEKLWASTEPWVPRLGDRVRWWRGKDSGTGTYHLPAHDPAEPPTGLIKGHWINLDDMPGLGKRGVWVEHVEPLSEEDA